MQVDTMIIPMITADGIITATAIVVEDEPESDLV